jgi:predicted tellurium resistance membrane protein TerC
MVQLIGGLAGIAQGFVIMLIGGIMSLGGLGAILGSIKDLFLG